MVLICFQGPDVAIITIIWTASPGQGAVNLFSATRPPLLPPLLGTPHPRTTHRLQAAGLPLLQQQWWLAVDRPGIITITKIGTKWALTNSLKVSTFFMKLDCKIWMRWQFFTRSFMAKKLSTNNKTECIYDFKFKLQVWIFEMYFLIGFFPRHMDC